jgi:hypothetical protein
LKANLIKFLRLPAARQEKRAVPLLFLVDSADEQVKNPGGWSAGERRTEAYP